VVGDSEIRTLEDGSGVLQMPGLTEVLLQDEAMALAATRHGQNMVRSAAILVYLLEIPIGRVS
jgi:hypothetical protein